MGIAATEISLADVYIAYRKAKAEAFFETTHFHAVAFTKYEQSLQKNLVALHRRITRRSDTWYEDPVFIGDYAYLPKSVDTSAWESMENGHFRALNPRDEWSRQHAITGREAEASLRLVMRPTVDFQVLSALWILKVGYVYDGSLDPNLAFANRVRSFGAGKKRAVNLATSSLFAPYFSAYRTWREKGLKAIESSLGSGESILAMTMDIERFYHRVAPTFMLRKDYLDALGITLAPWQQRMTRFFLRAIDTWYRSTPDWSARKQGAIPVGLSASKVIANVLLAEFDREFVRRLSPIHYGRYVDDIFLVLRADSEDVEAATVIQRMATDLSPLVALKSNTGAPPSLLVKLPYAKDSELLFAGSKQKIFALSSEHGEDLVRHIREQIRQRSSEYRLLPAVPATAVEMAARALLATPDASLQVDALRKADVVSVRRLGFSLLLSDIETYAADIKPDGWRKVRFEFYELAKRHVLTPVGFFDYFGYVHRIFGLMLACGDLGEAKELVDEIVAVRELLVRTTTLSTRAQEAAFALCTDQYAVALLQAGLQAATARSVTHWTEYLRVLRRLKRLSRRVVVPSTVDSLQRLVRQMLLADWGRRPYKDYWFTDQLTHEEGPPVPRQHSIRKQFRLGAIRRLRTQATNLKAPHWPALVFPTRPLRVDEIVLLAPDLLKDPVLLRDAISLFRGARVTSHSQLGYFSVQDDESGETFFVPGKPKGPLRVAVTSVQTTETQWEAAAQGRADRSIERYERFNGLLNRILRENRRPDYIVLPELSIPLRWATRAARKLAENGVSLIAGVEYHRDKPSKRLRNDCLVSLTTRWPGYPSSVVVLQPKFEPAHAERRNLRLLLRSKGAVFEPSGVAALPTVYSHRGFHFSILICSDLTNIAHRHALRGHVDAVFALEWNPDTDTFGSLVESTASDMHAFIIQVNNRLYGDSRIRAPAKQSYHRDIVQVKGGSSDYYVLGEIDVDLLRKEQRRKKLTKAFFKPTPIGYKMSRSRRKA